MEFEKKYLELMTDYKIQKDKMNKLNKSKKELENEIVKSMKSKKLSDLVLGGIYSFSFEELKVKDLTNEKNVKKYSPIKKSVRGKMNVK